MLIVRDIEFTSPMLAQRPTEQGDSFKTKFDKTRNPGGQSFTIVNNIARWNWAFAEARDSLLLTEVSTMAIIPHAEFVVDRTVPYRRRYRKGNTSGEDKFEAITTGKVVRFEFTLARVLPPGSEHDQTKRPPTEAEFDAMLAHIGKYLGMSEWGNHYAYGRFVVKNS